MFATVVGGIGHIVSQTVFGFVVDVTTSKEIGGQFFTLGLDIESTEVIWTLSAAVSNTSAVQVLTCVALCCQISLFGRPEVCGG